MASIWKQGFSLDTDETEARNEAIKRAKAADRSGNVVNVEVIRTAEHEANNEFLVRVDIS